MEESKVKSFIKKLKTIKHIEIIIGVVIVCLIVIIYTSISLGGGTQTTNAGAGGGGGANVGSNVNSSITRGLELRLSEVLSSISGAGDVSVLITFASSPELIPAKTTNSHTSSSQNSTTTTETQSPIIVNNEMVILREIMPEIIGVVVVAEGARDARVRVELMRATQAVLGVQARNIEVFSK